MLLVWWRNSTQNCEGQGENIDQSLLFLIKAILRKYVSSYESQLTHIIAILFISSSLLILARKIGFVNSFEGLICEFDSKVSKRAEELNTRHDQEKGDLAQLKQNFRRLEKRMRRQGGNFHSIHHVRNSSTETQSSQPRRNAEKYQTLQENSRRDTDC